MKDGWDFISLGGFSLPPAVSGALKFFNDWTWDIFALWTIHFFALWLVVINEVPPILARHALRRLKVDGVIWEMWLHRGEVRSRGPYCPADLTRLELADTVGGARKSVIDDGDFTGRGQQLYCPECSGGYGLGVNPVGSGTRFVGQSRSDAERRFEREFVEGRRVESPSEIRQRFRDSLDDAFSKHGDSDK